MSVTEGKAMKSPPPPLPESDTIDADMFLPRTVTVIGHVLVMAAQGAGKLAIRKATRRQVATPGLAIARPSICRPTLTMNLILLSTSFIDGTGSPPMDQRRVPSSRAAHRSTDLFRPGW